MVLLLFFKTHPVSRREAAASAMIAKKYIAKY